MKTDEHPGALTPDDIRRTAYDFQQSRVLLTAFELGLFTALGNERKTSSEMAEEMGANPRALDRLMNTLTGMDLLRKEDDLFGNTDASLRLLVQGQPEYMAGLMHTVNLWSTWSTLTEAVSKGTAVAHRDVNDRGADWLTSFIAAMHARAVIQAPSVIAQLDLSGVSRVLDVGGGSGAYAMALSVQSRESGRRCSICRMLFLSPGSISRGKGSLTRSARRPETIIGTTWVMDTIWCTSALSSTAIPRRKTAG